MILMYMYLKAHSACQSKKEQNTKYHNYRNISLNTIIHSLCVAQIYIDASLYQIWKL